MQQRGLKIIINGVASYVPYKKETIAFWAERNNILKKTIKGQKGRDVEKNLATVTEATPEEVEKYIFPKPVPAAPKKATANQSNELEILKAAFADQAKRLKELEAAANGGEEKKGKPGRKPKEPEQSDTNTDEQL